MEAEHKMASVSSVREPRASMVAEEGSVPEHIASTANMHGVAEISQRRADHLKREVAFIATLARGIWEETQHIPVLSGAISSLTKGDARDQYTETMMMKQFSQHPHRLHHVWQKKPCGVKTNTEASHLCSDPLPAAAAASLTRKGHQRSAAEECRTQYHEDRQVYESGFSVNKKGVPGLEL
ncbi:hypothetical protein F7725_013985 [Dissostichus mawsoni]|uniref:Uncharacterized protein n=1 Tax=Dissostichus mawsoni TaxID=36200 RepID=A0A7J5YXS6_DISMA|nr:hypothetical protein F7725_013985 [Dissostichus mawsoni]